MTVPPSLACPTPWCPGVLTVIDDECGICGTTFKPRELWEVYESKGGTDGTGEARGEPGR